MGQRERMEQLIQEIRRGALTLSVLSQLKRPEYGYSLLRLLSEKGLEMDQNTLYPLLRRLESQGLLESQWEIQGSRPRRYYLLSATGREVLDELKEQWHHLVRTVDALLLEAEEG